MLDGIIAGLSLLLGAPAVLCAQAPIPLGAPSANTPPITLKLSCRQSAQYEVTLGQAAPTLLAPEKQATLEAPGVRLKLESDDHLRIENDRPVALRTDACAAWQALLPAGGQTEVRLDPPTRLLELAVLGGSADRVALRLCDGAQASLGAGGRIRFGPLDDQSYYLAGEGDVRATNADGQSLVLAPGRPPLVGGPLGTTGGANGVSAMRRLSPVSAVALSGDPAGSVNAVLGNQTATVTPSARQRLVAANGALVELRVDRAAGRLRCRVERGYFTFTVDGIEGWQVTGLAGQSFALQWVVAQRSVSVVNLAPTGGSLPFASLLVAPGPGLFARLGGQTTLQITQLDGPNEFSTAATGDAVLWSPATGRETSLTARNWLVVGGNPGDGSWSPIAGGHHVIIAGDTRTGLDLTGDLGPARVRPGGTTTLGAEPNARLEGRLTGDNRALLRSVEGRFYLSFRRAPLVVIQIETRNAVSFVVDLQAGTISVLGERGNTPNGASFFFLAPGESLADATTRSPVELLPTGPLSISLDQSGLYPGEGVARVFYEAAGAGTEGLAPQGAGPANWPTINGLVVGPRFNALGDQIDSSRIIQTPLSTFH